MRTGERSDEFPPFPAGTPREAVYVMDPAWRAQARTIRCFFEASGVRWMVGSGSGAPHSSSAMAKQHSTSRAVALRCRPRLMIEVIYTAEVLGIDPVRMNQESRPSPPITPPARDAHSCVSNICSGRN